MPTEIVVLGGAGQLGAELVREFRQRGYPTVGLDRAELDITDAERVEPALASLDPKVVLNAAAYNQVDVAEEEPQAAMLVNALAVRNIALACRQMGALLVHFSTDHVFDGLAQRPYTEDDIPHPLNAYAVSKLAGELYAQAYLEKPLIVRTAGVFGPGALLTARGNFIESMLRMAPAGPIRVVEDHVATPTYAPLLAARTADLVERNQTGIFHIGGGTALSWYDYARMIFEVAGITPELRATNEREYRTAARRPKYTALSNAKIDALGLSPMPPLQAAVRSYFGIRARLLAGEP